MAEIEFKRRGTPLWAVVLGLLAVAALIYALATRGGDESPAPADGAAPQNAPAQPSPATPPPTAATTVSPAAPAGGVALFGRWVDSTRIPTDATQQRATVARGLRLLADALQERLPLAGAQIVLVRSMADSLERPGQTANQLTNSAQAGFFAVAFAMRALPAGERLNQAAAAIQLATPLTEQREEVTTFFQAAREAMRDPSQPIRDPNEARRPPATPRTAPGATPGATPGAPTPGA